MLVIIGQQISLKSCCPQPNLDKTNPFRANTDWFQSTWLSEVLLMNHDLMIIQLKISYASYVLIIKITQIIQTTFPFFGKYLPRSHNIIFLYETFHKVSKNSIYKGLQRMWKCIRNKTSFTKDANRNRQF